MRIAQEVATLCKSLPLSPSSFVAARVDESHMDVMKVLVSGPQDTPYAYGCFLFDVYFPPEYPATPVLITLRTTGGGTVRFNPNLYSSGKVCLSLLGTWPGRPEEQWSDKTSTLLQVLVSIQALIMVPDPFFNEPGLEQLRGTAEGDRKNLEYNLDIRAHTVVWAMCDMIEHPPAMFAEAVRAHFRLKTDDIMMQCGVWVAEAARSATGSYTTRLIAAVERLQAALISLSEDD